jgi:hypothetical protein
MVRMGPLGSRVLPPSRPWCSSARPLHHPADSSRRSHWTRLDPTRPRPIPPPEQARSVWSRPDRRGSPAYGSGGQAMAVPADAAPCGRVPGRTSGVAVDGAAAGCPAWPCRRVRTTLPRSRVSAASTPAGCRCPPAASAVHVSAPSTSAGCADLARNPSRCPRNRTPRQCPLDVRESDEVLAGRPRSAADTAAAPLSRAGTWRSPAADRPCTPRRLRQWTPTAACGVDAAPEPRRGRLSRPGCPPHGMLPAADTAAVSAVVPELRHLVMPSGRLVSAVDTAAAWRTLRQSRCRVL